MLCITYNMGVLATPAYGVYQLYDEAIFHSTNPMSHTPQQEKHSLMSGCGIIVQVPIHTL